MQVREPQPPLPQFESVETFCKRVGISRGLFNKMRTHGDGPVITRLGDRLLISSEDSATWLAARREVPAGKAA